MHSTNLTAVRRQLEDYQNCCSLMWEMTVMGWDQRNLSGVQLADLLKTEGAFCCGDGGVGHCRGCKGNFKQEDWESLHCYIALIS